MSFFRCSRCGCAEDTALCHYWSSRIQGKAALCSACDPKIAKWHNQFPQESAAGWVSDAHGFIHSKREVERWLGRAIDVVK